MQEKVLVEKLDDKFIQRFELLEGIEKRNQELAKKGLKLERVFKAKFAEWWADIAQYYELPETSLYYDPETQQLIGGCEGCFCEDCSEVVVENISPEFVERGKNLNAMAVELAHLRSETKKLYDEYNSRSISLWYDIEKAYGLKGKKIFYDSKTKQIFEGDALDNLPDDLGLLLKTIFGGLQ